MSTNKTFRKNSGSILFILSLILTLALAGCGTAPQKTTPEKNAGTGTASTQQTTYPLTLKDNSGTEVTIPAEPKRIVSFVPSSTETLFALGLEGKVVAVTKYDDYPQGVQQKVEYVFEDSLHPNTEQILKLNPDLIILGMHDEKTITAIRNLKIPVVVFNPQNLDSTYQTIEKLGQVTNKPEQAKKIVSAMKEKEQNIAQKVATVKEADRLNVFVEVDPNLFTPGAGTFLDQLVTKAGGINIAHDVTGWAQYRSEQVISKNPQVIFDTYSYYQKNAKEEILSRQGWQNIEAVKNQRVIDLDSDMLTRPGPRITDGLESIAKALYPDLFK